MPKLDVPERLNIFVQDNTRCVPVVQVYNRVTHGLPTSSVEEDHLIEVSSIPKPSWIAIDVDEKFPSLRDAQSKVGFFSFPVRHDDFENSNNLEAANIQSGSLSSTYVGKLAFVRSKTGGRVSLL